MSHILTATGAGIVTGLFCWKRGLIALHNTYSFPQVGFIFFNRVVIGYAIGTSGLSNMNWHAHGLLQGLIVGSEFVL
jgi:hypothetical protein